MQRTLVTFYGTVCDKGYEISHLLLDRRIEHEFVLLDDFIGFGSRKPLPLW